MGIVPWNLTPAEHSDGDRRWIYPVMDEVIRGIQAGVVACVQLGIEFIESDTKLPFGKRLKSKTARALRRATLGEPQKQRIRIHVFGLLSRGHIPHEFLEYAKLVRSIGFRAEEIPKIDSPSPYVSRFSKYFQQAIRISDKR